MECDLTSARLADGTGLGRVWTFVRGHARGAAIEALVNFILPYLIFAATRRSLGDVTALIAASAPPIGWSIIEFARRRRIDALSLLVLAGIALSLVAFFGGGGVRFLQMRERLVTAAIGLVFLGSAAIGKPLIYQLARARMKRRPAEDGGWFEALRDHPIFKRAMMIMTLAWGVNLVAESAIACVLVFQLPIQAFLVVSPILGYSWVAALTAWTFWYARRKVTAAREAVASGV